MSISVSSPKDERKKINGLTTIPAEAAQPLTQDTSLRSECRASPKNVEKKL